MTQAQDTLTKLDKLLQHGRKNIWDPIHDIDWAKGSLEFEKLGSGDRQALASLLSLVYYSDSQGKEILSALCRGLDKDKSAESELSRKAHEFFVQQMDDENRHATGIEKLIVELKLELEPQAWSHLFYSKILRDDRLFHGKLILIYWYIEVLAKGIFQALKKRFPETSIDALFSKILRDEARHVGFGEVYIPAKIPKIRRSLTRQMAFAHYASAFALPALYRFTPYAKAARQLQIHPRELFVDGMIEICAKAQRLPQDKKFLDLSQSTEWFAAFL